MNKAQSLLTHQQTDDGIHEVVFLDKSKDAAAQLMDILESFCGDMARDADLRVLVDFRQSGIPPLNYAAERGRALIRDFPDRPNMRIAYLAASRFASVARVGEAVFALFARDKHRVFAEDQRAAAIAWLLESN